MTLEPYQLEAAQWLARGKLRLLVAPAGVGKTVILSAALDIVLRAKERSEKISIGWLCNTIEQSEQARAAMANFPSIEQMATVTVACSAADLDWSNMNVLVCDEVHRGTAPLYYKQIKTCRGAVWGMTATPVIGNPERDKQLLDLFDNHVFTVDRAAASSRLVSARVIMLDASDAGLQEKIDAEIERLLPIRRHQFRWAKKAPDEHELYRMVSWQACVEIGIVGNKARNDAAVACAIKHRDQHVLMVVNRVEHAEEMAERIGTHAVACFAKMGKKKRAKALDAFRTGELKCVVGTSLLNEGIDLPMAEVLVMVSAGRSNVQTEQKTGRVLRTFAGKTEGLIYDFRDSTIRLMANHSRKRQALYRKLGYQVENAYQTETKGQWLIPP